MADFGKEPGSKRRVDRFLHIVADEFQQSGWNIVEEPWRDRAGADLLIEQGGLRYVVECKSISDGKRARLLPLVSMAILQSRAAAQLAHGLKPLAVVVAPLIDDDVAEDIGRFASEYAPDVAVGVIDLDGLRRFWGDGLDQLNSERPHGQRKNAIKSADVASHLFSDLNQWLLKVLIGQRLPEELINVPRREFDNASQLANAAGVSAMSAFRVLRQLENEGFLDKSAQHIRIGNLERLLHHWQAVMLRPQKEIPFRWIIRGRGLDNLFDAVRAHQQAVADSSEYEAGRDDWIHRSKARLCLGGFAAASWLGYGHVGGVPPLLYLDRMDPDLLRKLGMIRIEDDRPVDVFVRVPSFKRSIFRAAVQRQGILVSDILQVWLESSVNPARGAEQATLIRRQLLEPLFEEVADEEK
jgi:hypothetical protein